MKIFTSKLDKEIAKLKRENSLLTQIAVEYLQEKKKVDRELSYLRGKWNDLVDEVNERGGREFLKGKKSNEAFTSKELISLIFLCHPDKHDQSDRAKIMTQKLILTR